MPGDQQQQPQHGQGGERGRPPRRGPPVLGLGGSPRGCGGRPGRGGAGTRGRRRGGEGCGRLWGRHAGEDHHRAAPPRATRTAEPTTRAGHAGRPRGSRGPRAGWLLSAASCHTQVRAADAIGAEVLRTGQRRFGQVLRAILRCAQAIAGTTGASRRGDRGTRRCGQAAFRLRCAAPGSGPGHHRWPRGPRRNHQAGVAGRHGNGGTRIAGTANDRRAARGGRVRPWEVAADAGRRDGRRGHRQGRGLGARVEPELAQDVLHVTLDGQLGRSPGARRSPGCPRRRR